MRGIKEELHEWRDISCSWIRRQNIVKMSVLPTLMYRFNAIPVKISPSYLVSINKLILEYKRELKDPG